MREELRAARRDSAVGEAREAELRRELSNLKRQVRSRADARAFLLHTRTSVSCVPQTCSTTLRQPSEDVMCVDRLAMQVEGVSPEEHRRLARELAERQRQCTTMELELRAALDKLEVYRWADNAAAAAPAATAATSAGALTVAGMSQQPDDEKSVEELRAELEQLRQAMALQGEEAQKVSPAATD